MLGLYLSALSFGGVLIAASFLFGGDTDHDVDAEGDFDAEPDVGAVADGADGYTEDLGGAASALKSLPFTSLRFWSFGSMTFGLAGTMLTAFVSSSLTVLAMAIAIGFGMGPEEGKDDEKKGRNIDVFREHKTGTSN